MQPEMEDPGSKINKGSWDEFPPEEESSLLVWTNMARMLMDQLGEWGVDIIWVDNLVATELCSKPVHHHPHSQRTKHVLSGMFSEFI